MNGVEPRLGVVAKSSNEKAAVEAIKALASRQAEGQSELILPLTSDENEAKRAAAIEAIGVLIDVKSVGSIVQLALDEKHTGDLSASVIGRFSMHGLTLEPLDIRRGRRESFER